MPGSYAGSPEEMTWLKTAPDEEFAPVVVDRKGGFYHIQPCCKVWDRGWDFHAPSCKAGLDE